jgi:DnaJ-class molecular chaperone
MPERIWSHTCCDTTANQPHCPSCGTPGDFAGWGPTVPEAMERYQRAHGLTPVGPHRQVAPLVFRRMRAPCDRCHGSGFQGDVFGWHECRVCEGGGAVWSAAESEILAAYRRVLDLFPEAAAPGALSEYGLIADECI